MILNKSLEQLLNKQYTNEIASALLYKNIAGFYADRYFPGISKFFEKKYEEELEHSQKFYEYINSRDGRAIIDKIDKMEFDENTLVSPFYSSLEHEQQVSSWIYELVDKSRECKDYATEFFLIWFVTEQVSEEEEFLQLIAELEVIKDSGDGLYQFDKKLSDLVVE